MMIRYSFEMNNEIDYTYSIQSDMINEIDWMFKDGEIIVWIPMV